MTPTATLDHEGRDIMLDLALDAAGCAHTDTVQRIAEEAIAEALERFENGQHSSLLMTAQRAAAVAATAALRALEQAGHLVPETASVTLSYQVVGDDGTDTDQMDEAEFSAYMLTNDLTAGQVIEVTRTVTTIIPAEAVLPDVSAPVTEEDF